MNGPSMGYIDVFPDRMMWQEMAKELGAEFKVRRGASQDYEIHQLSLPYKDCIIQSTVSSHRPLKFQIAFKRNLDFDMIISWEDFLERLFKKIRKPEIQLHHKEFDKHYLIKSNRPDLLKRILSREIQEIMLKYNIYSISYQFEKEMNETKLLSVIQRQAGGSKMIYELIYMFQLWIDALEKAKIIK